MFDLGGVVLDIDFGRALAAWTPHSRLPAERLHDLFAQDASYEQHETGALAPEAYFAHLRESLALSCEAAAIRAGWNAILVGEIAETLRLVDQVRGALPCYAVTNTNAVHLEEIRRAFPALLPRFRQVFASHEVGHRKPQPGFFLHVLREIGAAPEQVLLFDDLPANVAGARACGLQAVLVRGPQDVRQALQERGLLAG